MGRCKRISVVLLLLLLTGCHEGEDRREDTKQAVTKGDDTKRFVYEYHFENEGERVSVYCDKIRRITLYIVRTINGVSVTADSHYGCYSAQ